MEHSMIRLAVIGTNWITKKFIDAAHDSEKFKLVAIYSRTMKNAKLFAAEYPVKNIYTSLEELATATEVDAVYIASPNSYHCKQAILMMQHGKHVICEKPLASNTREVQKMLRCAKKNKVVLFEAFKTAYLPNFIQLWQQLPELGTLRKVMFSYCQYSSRFQDYLEGKNPNTFNPEFSNGSLMDIGFYCLASMVALFGEPNKVKAMATLLDSGVDGHGSIIAQYEGFDVVISHSKVSDSNLPSIIQGEQANLIIDKISDCSTVKLVHREKGTKDLSIKQYENTMRYEAEAFAELVKNNQVEHVGLELSLSVAKLLTSIRRQVGITFPADKR